MPQIEVSFDIDANGLLNVTAEDKGTGKSQNIVIKNENGRLSKEDIEKMVADAEKFKEEDEKSRQRVDAKNELETYLYSTKNMINNDEMKLPDDKKKKIEDLISEKIKWLDENSTASTDEFKSVKKEVEEIVGEELKPTMPENTDNNTNEPAFAGNTSEYTSEPTIEEID